MTKSYWVASNGESPHRIYFDENRAWKEETRDGTYLDVFDDEGNFVEYWKLVNNSWTEDF